MVKSSVRVIFGVVYFTVLVLWLGVKGSGFIAVLNDYGVDSVQRLKSFEFMEDTQMVECFLI
jgi:hypothetical protein